MSAVDRLAGGEMKTELSVATFVVEVEGLAISGIAVKEKLKSVKPPLVQPVAPKAW